jgi:hypothetical protein
MKLQSGYLVHKEIAGIRGRRTTLREGNTTRIKGENMKGPPGGAEPPG